jgi:hypothetical protein
LSRGHAKVIGSGGRSAWCQWSVSVARPHGGVQTSYLGNFFEAQIAAMRADDWPGAFGLASPDLQAQYGTPAALRDDVTAHYAPLPAITVAQFIDIVTFRGLPTYG